jgi:hypothetical protein
VRDDVPSHGVGGKQSGVILVAEAPKQAYNAQTAVNEQQISLAAEITVDAPDFRHLAPTLDAALRELSEQGIAGQPEAVIADAGYWHTAQITAIAERGIEVLVPWEHARGHPAGWENGLFEQMRRKRRTGDGRELCAQREVTVEPVVGQMKHNRRLDRFMRRGRAVAQSEWRLVAAIHNTLTLHNHWVAEPPEPAAGRPARLRLNNETASGRKPVGLRCATASPRERSSSPRRRT